MKIHVFGASGSGTTTLANEISQRMGFIHLDADDYYWKKTNPPYQEKIPLDERNESLKKDFKNSEKVIISGSLVTWGEYWLTAFDLGIFLLIPQNIRMERLVKREKERYGKNLETDSKIIETSEAFLDWAKNYDDPDFNGRNITQHLNWINHLSCNVLRLEGDLHTKDLLKLISKEILERVALK